MDCAQLKKISLRFDSIACMHEAFSMRRMSALFWPTACAWREGGRVQSQPHESEAGFT